MTTNLKARGPVWVACIVVSAAALRLVPFLARPLWYDEIFTVWAARLDPSRLLEALRADSGPPLFYMVCRPIVLLAESFHASDLLVRLPSYAAGLAALVGAAFPSEKDSRLRYLALVAISPLLIVYAAEARPYALLGLEGLALFLLALRAPQTGGRLAALAAVCAAALYTHYLAVFLVIAIAGVALARGRRRPAVALLAGTAAFLPWITVLERQPPAATAWMQEPLGTSIGGFLSALGGAGRLPAPFGPPLPAALMWTGAAVGLLAAAALASGRGAPREAGAVCLLALLGILAAGALRPVAFAGRSELAVLPIWLFGLAEAGSVSRLARAAVNAIAVTSALACAFVLAGLPREAPAYSALSSRLAREARAGDVVFAGGAFYLPARLAADRGELRARLLALPAELGSHPGWIPAAMPGSADIALVEHESREIPPPSRAWLLLPRLLITPRLVEAFAGGASVSAVEDRPDAVLLVR